MLWLYLNLSADPFHQRTDEADGQVDHDAHDDVDDGGGRIVQFVKLFNSMAMVPHIHCPFIVHGLVLSSGSSSHKLWALVVPLLVGTNCLRSPDQKLQKLL